MTRVAKLRSTTTSWIRHRPPSNLAGHIVWPGAATPLCCAPGPHFCLPPRDTEWFWWVTATPPACRTEKSEPHHHGTGTAPNAAVKSHLWTRTAEATGSRRRRPLGGTLVRSWPWTTPRPSTPPQWIAQSVRAQGLGRQYLQRTQRRGRSNFRGVNLPVGRTRLRSNQSKQTECFAYQCTRAFNALSV